MGGAEEPFVGKQALFPRRKPKGVEAHPLDLQGGLLTGGNPVQRGGTINEEHPGWPHHNAPPRRSVVQPPERDHNVHTAWGEPAVNSRTTRSHRGKNTAWGSTRTSTPESHKQC